MKKFVVIDLETTGHSPDNDDKIIEIGMVIINDDEIVDKRDTFLNPNKKIPPFITNLTNITNDDVKDAPYFNEKADKIMELFEDSYLIAHNVPFDMGFLNAELVHSGRTPLRNPVIDTVELSRILYPKAPSYKLSQITDYLGIYHDEPHRALSDAYVTAKLFLKLKEKLFQLPYETLANLAKLEPMFKSNLANMLNEAMERNSFAFADEAKFATYNGLAFKMIEDTVKEEMVLATSFGDYLDHIYEEEGTLEKQFEKYEKRSGQREMSETVYDAFRSEEHALVEAETGTGKSLAYLLPAVYEAVKQNKRIIISTYTTQLQTQLLEEEIPLVQKIVDFPFEAALLKGRNHYLSLERFAYELSHLERDNYDTTLTKAILLVWLTETVTGDIDEIQLPTSGYTFFQRVSADAERKLDVTSPWFRYSFYTRARRRAGRADLIITNHALLCTDMFNDYQFLPVYDKVIIDEAHHLEDTAAYHYGLKLDNITMHYTLNQIGRSEDTKFFNYIVGKYEETEDKFSLEKWDELITNTKNEIDDLYQYLHAYVTKQRKKDKSLSDVGRIQFRFSKETVHASNWEIITEMVNRLIFYYRDLIYFLSLIDKSLEDEEDYVKNDRQEFIQVMENLQDHIDHLELLFLVDQDIHHVQWLEMDTRGYQQAVYLYSEPTNVSTLLGEELFAKKDSVILTSATLTMKNSFNFIIKRLGLPKERLITKQIRSPFSFKDQVQLLIPNDFPDIKYGNMDDYIYATSEAILSLAEVTEGRMLVLFTSYDMLRKSYKLLKEIMTDDKYMLIGQGITSGSRTRLKKNFQSFERSILLGTSSFWEGVDIPGEDLSCLMIVRLPFQPPDHPVYEAKSQELKEEGRNAFMELSLPNAVIKFKQGFGRLIRSSSDRGIVFICDSRIVKARYGRYFTESIPEVLILNDSTQTLIEQARKWF
nr:ATP-dependent DNA helicase DinG [Oceanobacillus alkalisoli]